MCPGADAGVVDEDVDATELFNRPTHGKFAL